MIQMKLETMQKCPFSIKTNTLLTEPKGKPKKQRVAVLCLLYILPHFQ